MRLAKLIETPLSVRRRLWFVSSAIWVFGVQGMVSVGWIENWAWGRNRFLYRPSWIDWFFEDVISTAPMALCLSGTAVLALVFLGLPWAMQREEELALDDVGKVEGPRVHAVRQADRKFGDFDPQMQPKPRRPYLDPAVVAAINAPPTDADLEKRRKELAQKLDQKRE